MPAKKSATRKTTPAKRGAGNKRDTKPARKPAKPSKQRAKAETKPRTSRKAAEPVIPQNTGKAPVERVEGGKFAPGVSGNPGGRPKSKPITDAFTAALARPFPLSRLPKALQGLRGKDGAELTFGDVIALGAIQKAISGNVDALKEIADRVEGRTAQRLEHTGRDGGPVDIATLTPEQRDEEIAKLASELGYTKAGE